MAYVTANPVRPINFKTFNPIKWLISLEAAYCDAQILKTTEDHHLRDMGITRHEADTFFYQRGSQNRYYSRAR